MEIVKYFTNEVFNKKGFADMLISKMSVKAIAVEDGVILDREAFNAYKPAYMPVWAWNNKRFINSPLHTIEVKAPW